jgi:hypothetical protein
MTGPVHYEIEVLCDTTFTTACGRGAAENLTTDDAQVTCLKCLAALGYQLPSADILSLEVKELPNGGYRVAA